MAQLTATQKKIYRYIKVHKEQVKDYSLRHLAAKLGVAPASVLRTINRLGYQHYYEFCQQLQQEVADQGLVDDITYQAHDYFSNIENYDQKIQQFKKLFDPATIFVFLGVGTSGDLASYGARQFVNNGREAYVIADPFYPIQLGHAPLSNHVVMILSVSGETEQMLEQAMSFHDQKATLVSITNDGHNSLAALADLNFSYHINSRIIGQSVNLTSQVPVVYLLERLAQVVHC